jgi:membrane protein YqaA with SNARE-associated domain
VYATCPDNIAVNAAIFGAVGGLVGWVLGRGFPRWAKIFP